jgi:hypothetical protein
MRHVTQFPGKAVCGRMLAVLMILSLCVAVADAVPIANDPPSGGVGAFFQFANNDSPSNYGTSTLNAYAASFGYTFDTYSGRNASGGSALLRFGPTPAGNSPLQAMSAANDWIFHAELNQNGGYASDFIIFGKDEPADVRIFALVSGNDANSFSIKVGNADGSGWIDVATGLSHSGFTDFDVHYKSASSEFDVYWAGNLVGTGPANNPQLSYVQASPMSTNGSGLVTSFRNFRLAQIPEPGSVMLLATGIAGLLAAPRRRRK